MELIEIMGTVTTIVTLGTFISGLPPCLEMYKTRDTKNIPFVMFIGYLLCSSQMLHYSLMLDNSLTLVVVSVVGSVMNFVYIIMYLIVVEPKGKTLGYIFLSLVYQGCFYYYLYYVIGTQPLLSDTLGASASHIVTLLLLPPLFEIIDNFKNKNADGTPMIMLSVGLLCSVCWLIYGIMLGDPNVYRPNIPGIAINVIKIAAIQIYKENGKKTD